MHGTKRQVEPDQHGPEVPLAEFLVEQVPEHLGPPEVEAGEDTEQGTSEDHVMEVSHDVVGVGLLGVSR